MKVWIINDGMELPISEMETNHINRTIGLLRKSSNIMADKYIKVFCRELDKRKIRSTILSGDKLKLPGDDREWFVEWVEGNDMCIFTATGYHSERKRYSLDSEYIIIDDMGGEDD